MLRLTKSRSAIGAKQYFDDALQVADYYQSGDKIVGRWFGSFARQLGLFGGVKRADFHALIENTHPVTGATLTGRQRANRIPGFDLTTSVPKSISILYARTRDPRLLSIHEYANDRMLEQVELDMKVRVRAGGVNRHDNRTTGNLAAAQFTHFFSRPVDGVADPHLHTHNYVLSLSMDDVEGKIKAAQIGDIAAHREFYEAIYHSELAKAARELGYEIDADQKYWEVAGIDQSLRDHYSRRTKQIEESAKQKKIISAGEKAREGLHTRAEKDADLSDDAMFELAMDRLEQQHEADLDATILSAEERAGMAREPITAEQAWEYALEHCFSRQSVVDETKLFSHALWRGFGDVTLEELKVEAEKSDLVRKEISTKINGQLSTRTMVTRQSLLAAEERMVDFVRSGISSCRPLGNAEYQFKDERLNAGQRNAVKHVLTSRNRVMMVAGGAGVGKTTALNELSRALCAYGHKVFAVATTTASRDTLAEAGFEDASTVQMLSVNGQLQQEVGKGALVLVDEASMLSIPQMNRLFDLAAAFDWRLVLVGDTNQHHSIEWGDAMRIIQDRGILRPAEITEIMRQSDAYKEAVEWIRVGDMDEAWKRLENLKAVEQSSDFITPAAEAYLEARKARKTALVAAPIHADKDQIAALIREQLREEKILMGREKHVFRLVPLDWTEPQKAIAERYEPGIFLRFHQNVPGAKRGSLWRVSGARADAVLIEDGEGQSITLPLEACDRYSLYVRKDIPLASGDDIRITRGGTTTNGKRLNAGDVHTVNAITKAGEVVVGDGQVIGGKFGHIDHAYCWTSHAAQSKSIHKVIVAMGEAALAAVNLNQFLVSVTRGKKEVAIVSDNLKAIKKATKVADDRASARELFRGDVDVHGRATTRQQRIAAHRKRINAAAQRLAEQRGSGVAVDADLMNQAREFVMAEVQRRMNDRGADIGR